MLADARLVDTLRLAVLVPLRLAVVLVRVAVVLVLLAVVLLRLTLLSVCVVVVLAVRRAVLLRLAVVAVCVAALLLLLSSFFIVKIFLSPSNFSIHWSTCVSLLFIGSLYQKQRLVLRKTSCCFRENIVLF